MILKSIDINADMGEAPEAWIRGPDTELVQVITSANIACGFHAGDSLSILKTIELCQKHGVGIGAHPSFNDRQGFGRQVPERFDAEEVALDVVYQIGSMQGVARLAGFGIDHVKLHGALANLASESIEIARKMFSAVSTAFPDLPVFTISETAQQRAAIELGIPFRAEIFADRAYNDDGTLVNRSRRGAVLHDPVDCAERVLGVVETGTIQSIDGNPVWLGADTVCVHGDTPQAIAIATTIRDRLEQAGIAVRKARSDRSELAAE